MRSSHVRFVDAWPHYMVYLWAGVMGWQHYGEHRVRAGAFMSDATMIGIVVLSALGETPKRKQLPPGIDESHHRSRSGRRVNC